MNNMYDKSPLNYVGGKYKMLPQIMRFFPRRINNMYDLFAGGCDVCTNIQANNIFANDINFFVIDIYRAFQAMNINELLDVIDGIIEEWDLSMDNEASYLAFRNHYNSLPVAQRNPIELYVLVCYSFNYQFRFNNHHGFNNPFGRNRSSFNSTMRENLIVFHSKLNNIQFTSCNFLDLNLAFLGQGDFLYADPPYRITTASYNDGRRGFEGWSLEDDLRLFELLDDLNQRGVKFALSNVTHHKGNTNDALIQWKRQNHYHAHRINYNYNNSNYHSQNTNQETREVLITNY
ncbi:Dam family site-specific DNA-(adenine-N6)-methyltransferase [Eubacterium sp. AM46-8]|nr:Dam family site-specific DNA-(adenine-N6)-methyltransferase [Eubacterium sp. AM46-8]